MWVLLGCCGLRYFIATILSLPAKFFRKRDSTSSES
jgi:hypothetical protein